MLTLCLSLCFTLPPPELPLMGGAGPHIILSQPEAELATDFNPPQLRVTFDATNDLPLPVQSVHVGLLFAATAEALRGADASDLYRQGSRTAGLVGVVRQEVPCTLPAHGRAKVLLQAELPAGAPQPLTFVTHVLGYTLAAVDAPTLLGMLGTPHASDEVAACATLGLTGLENDPVTAKQQARRRFAGDEALTQALVATATAPPAAKPSQGEMLRRVFAVRALGVLGSDAARGALQALQQSGALQAFDEPFQILRIARVRGSPWDTPLAFAVPESSRRMQEVVDAALDDALHLPAAPAAPAPKPAPEPAPADSATFDAAAWGLIALAVLLGVAGFGWRRRRRRVRS